jgi:hypothetical protein
MFAFSPASPLLEDEIFLDSSTWLVTMDWSISMSLSSLSLIEEGDSAWGLFVEEGVSPDASLFSSVWNRHHDSSSIPFPWYLSKQRRSFFDELLQLIVFWTYVRYRTKIICSFAASWLVLHDSSASVYTWHTNHNHNHHQKIIFYVKFFWKFSTNLGHLGQL